MNATIQNIISILNKSDRTEEDLLAIDDMVRGLVEFSNYIRHLGYNSVNQLYRSVKVEEFNKNQLVFNKNDPSDKLYVILSGSIDVYDVQSNQNLSFVGRLTKGKMIGERGLATRRPRSLTAIAHSNTLLITVLAKDFRQILETSVLVNLEEKMQFLLRHLPCMQNYSKSALERVAYVLEHDIKRKGEVIINANENYNFVCFVKEGSAAVVSERGRKYKIVIRLEEGSAVADECTFLNIKSHFKVIVISKTAYFYKARRSEFLSQISSETFQQLKKQCKFKLNSHLELKSKSTPRLPPLSLKSSLSSHLSLASPQAKRTMECNFSFSRVRDNETTLNDLDAAYCKLQLELMRDCTTNRLKKFSTDSAIIKRFKLRPSLARDL